MQCYVGLMGCVCEGHGRVGEVARVARGEQGGDEGGDGDGQCVDDWRAMRDGVLWLE